MRLSTPKTLQALQKRRRALLREMLRPDPLIVGTVCEVLRRCGTPTCHCAKTPGHRQTLLLYGEGGRRTSRFIRSQDVAQVRRAWQRYRRFREALRELRTLNTRELQLLRVQITLRQVQFPVGGNSEEP
jgi:uncharacterized protein YjiS (DUF1127 family)